MVLGTSEEKRKIKNYNKPQVYVTIGPVTGNFEKCLQKHQLEVCLYVRMFIRTFSHSDG